MSSIVSRIRTECDFLSKTETKIALLLLENPREFTRLTIGDVAARAGVSQGSVNNFAAKFCDGGFARLKLEVAAALAHEAQEPAVGETTEPHALLRAKRRNTVTAFTDTEALNTGDTLQHIADRLLHADKIALYGLSTSGIVARDFYFQLVQMGLPALHFNDVLMSDVAASQLTKDSVMVAISASGRTRDTLETVQIARQNGAFTVGMTANRHSPLAKEADAVLLSSSGYPDDDDRIRQIRLSHLLLVDTLCTYLRRALYHGDYTGYYKLLPISNLHSVED